MALPSNVDFGTVTGVALRTSDGAPVGGVKFTFTPSLTPALVKVVGSVSPVMVRVDPVIGTTNEFGVLCRPDGDAGVVLPASADADLNPSGWTWVVSTQATKQWPATSATFVVLPDAVLDLTDIVNVSPSLGVEIAAWTAVVDEVTTLRDETVAAAATVPSSASIDSSIAQAVAPANSTLAGRLSEVQLSATIVASALGSNIGRFLRRAQSGESLKIVALGDSVLEGKTVTNVTTDGTIALLAADLTSRFGGTVSAVNYAVSGYTAAASFIKGRVSSAVAEKGDLYVIALGKNDVGYDRASESSRPVPGYPLASSMAMLELMMRLIRSEVPTADIMLIAENPYTPIENVQNPFQVAWIEASKRIAANYGAEFVDAYTPFTLLSASGMSAVIPDGTHPNTAGHRIMADEVLRHLPLAYAGPSIPNGAVAATGVYSPEKIDTGTTQRGWAVIGQPTSTPVSGLSWVNTGSGWSGASPYATSLAGDYAEFIFTGSELLLEMATNSALVANVTVDGTQLYASKSFTSGKQGSAYLVPVVTGLAVASQHTVRITLVSGALSVTAAAALKGKVAASSYDPHVVTVDMGSSTTAVALPSDGSIQYIVNSSAAVPLPNGWNSMDVVFMGYMVLRVVAATTTERLLGATLRVDLAISQLLQQNVPPRSAPTGFAPFSFAYTAINKTAAVGVRFEARVQSTDKDSCDRYAWSLQAVCHRRS